MHITIHVLISKFKVNELGSCRLFNHNTEEWAYGDWVGIKPNTIPHGVASQGIATFCQHPSNPDKRILEIFPTPKLKVSTSAIKPEQHSSLNDKDIQDLERISLPPSTTSQNASRVPTSQQVLRPFYLVDGRGKLVSPFTGESVTINTRSSLLIPAS